MLLKYQFESFINSRVRYLNDDILCLMNKKIIHEKYAYSKMGPTEEHNLCSY